MSVIDLSDLKYNQKCYFTDEEWDNIIDEYKRSSKIITSEVVIKSYIHTIIEVLRPMASQETIRNASKIVFDTLKKLGK